ncbi:MAG: hypothetical protein FJ087_15215 [Deltaproteobacteria bacterium]|nr:hypothetical protein [Deltaproteobacteria bacterium]
MRRTAAALVLAASAASAVPALAGNSNTFHIGARAAGMGGAYTAMAEEGSVAWYNPAGLGYNDRSSVDVSASAFFLELVQVPGLLRTVMPSGAVTPSDFSTSSFQVVPTSLSYVMRLGDGKGGGPRHSLALSVFVPQSVKYASSLVVGSKETAGDYRQKLAVEDVATRYLLGPSWGIAIGRWAVGASLYATYGLETRRAEFYQDVARPEGSHFFALNGGAMTVTELGLAWAVGAQCRATDRLRVGLVIRPPSMRLYRSVDGSWLEARSLPARDDPARIVSEFEETRASGSTFSARMASPLSFAFGAAWLDEGRFAVSADADYALPFRDDEEGIDRKGVFNARAGAEIWLAPRWAIEFGAFTDFSPERSASSLASKRVDFYGASLAVSRLSAYDVTGSDKTDRITFASTFGVRYAFGYGEMGGLDVLPATDESRRKRPAAMIHDISVIVGTSMQF